MHAHPTTARSHSVSGTVRAAACHAKSPTLLAPTCPRLVCMAIALHRRAGCTWCNAIATLTHAVGYSSWHGSWQVGGRSAHGRSIHHYFIHRLSAPASFHVLSQLDAPARCSAAPLVAHSGPPQGLLLALLERSRSLRRSGGERERECERERRMGCGPRGGEPRRWYGGGGAPRRPYGGRGC